MLRHPYDPEDTTAQLTIKMAEIIDVLREKVGVCPLVLCDVFAFITDARQVPREDGGALEHWQPQQRKNVGAKMLEGK